LKELAILFAWAFAARRRSLVKLCHALRYYSGTAFEFFTNISCALDPWASITAAL
jgi:hypothetical protein